MSNAQAAPTIAVVLAGGVGARMGLSIPKQLIKIAGKTVIEHTIENLNASPDIDEILVLMTPGYLDPIQPILKSGKYSKFSTLLEGGSTRNETSRIAIAALSQRLPDKTKVLFHDAVRPFVDERILKDLSVALEHSGAVDTAIASADTLIEVDDEGYIVDVPDRSRMRRGQTPQGFHLDVIRRAYELAGTDPDFQATDDCSVVLRYTPEVRIAVVPGSDKNMKVTEPIDVAIADKLFQLGSAVVDAGTDESRRAAMSGKTLVIFGGSYGIGQEVARLAEHYGATVHNFSRSSTNTHVQNRAEVRAALEEAAQASGSIDYVVNSAGLLTMGTLESVTDEMIHETIDVNLLAPILIAQESLPYLRTTNGHLINYTSSSYTRGRANYSLYSATKAAIVNLTQALSEEWAEDGIRVSCVNPERTRTPMRTNAFGTEPIDTLLDASEVGAVTIDLLGSRSTGQVIDVRRPH